MLRTLAAAARTLVLAPVFLGYTLIQSIRVNRASRRSADLEEIEALARAWSGRFVDIPPITLTVEGLENVDPEKQYIVVSNHLSNFDIPVAVRALPMPTRFISKNEVSRIPVFGDAAVAAGVVMVERESVRSSHEQLNRAIRETMAMGNSVLVFAEGTRSRTGEMGAFHRGAARIALSMGAEILPIAISGTFEVNPPGSPVIYPGEVTVRILPPISLEGMATQDVPAITDDLRRQIGKAYEEMSGRQRQS